MSDQQSPHEALAMVRKSREQVFDKMNYWPWWFDAGYASACALLVAGQGIGLVIGSASTAIALVILGLIVQRYQAETGVWVNGYGPKRARWAAIGLGVLMIGLMLVSVYFGRRLHITWVPFVCGAAGAVLGLIGMRVWMYLYRKDVRALS